jgi:hypothetical protein
VQFVTGWVRAASKVKALSEPLQRQQPPCFARSGAVGGVVDVGERDGNFPFLDTFWCLKKADVTVPIDSPDRHRRARLLTAFGSIIASRAAVSKNLHRRRADTPRAAEMRRLFA